jgi:hypothetical protein
VQALLQSTKGEDAALLHQADMVPSDHDCDNKDNTTAVYYSNANSAKENEDLLLSDSSCSSSAEMEMRTRFATGLINDCTSAVVVEIFNKASQLVVAASSPLSSDFIHDIHVFSDTLVSRMHKDVESRIPLLVMLQ